jgi:hypothetical protein
MVFEGADTSGFEADSRLTAIWLWTLSTGKSDSDNGDIEEQEASDDDSETSTKKPKIPGFVLEYDAARKIAQGLGARLENLGNLVEIAGEQARLLPVAERTRYLFGKDEGKAVAPQRKKRETQMELFKVLESAESTGSIIRDTKLGPLGETVLDRIHQSMILFAVGRGEALKHLLVEGEVGHDPRFWRLAQALSALYPKGSDEKRWVDGVLARKKGLGL